MFWRRSKIFKNCSTLFKAILKLIESKMKPNFKNINIKSSPKPKLSKAEWEKENKIDAGWLTPEQIPVKPVYTEADLENHDIQVAAAK